MPGSHLALAGSGGAGRKLGLVRKQHLLEHGRAGLRADHASRATGSTSIYDIWDWEQAW